ncbi:hypothetical protein HDU67_001290 [Dinochytrium kinnereticum]|nr:hypothetical protein HDU67_001290 [Dinochytrium kinnereticum]
MEGLPRNAIEGIAYYLSPLCALKLTRLSASLRRTCIFARDFYFALRHSRAFIARSSSSTLNPSSSRREEMELDFKELNVVYVAALIYVDGELGSLKMILPIKSCKAASRCFFADDGPYCYDHKRMFAMAFEFLIDQIGLDDLSFLWTRTIFSLSSVDLLHKVPLAVARVQSYYEIFDCESAACDGSHHVPHLCDGKFVTDAIYRAVLSRSLQALRILWVGRLPPHLDIGYLVQHVAAWGWADVLKVIMELEDIYQENPGTHFIKSAGGYDVLKFVTYHPRLSFDAGRFCRNLRVADSLDAFLASYSKSSLKPDFNVVAYDLYHRRDGRKLIVQLEVPESCKRAYLNYALARTDVDNMEGRIWGVLGLIDQLGDLDIELSSILELAVCSRDASAVRYIFTNFSEARPSVYLVWQAFRFMDGNVLDLLVSDPRIDIYSLADHSMLAAAAKSSLELVLRFLRGPRLADQGDFEKFVCLVRESVPNRIRSDLLDFSKMDLNPHAFRFAWIIFELYPRYLSDNEMLSVLEAIVDEDLFNGDEPTQLLDAKIVLERLDDDRIHQALCYSPDLILQLLCFAAQVGSCATISSIINEFIIILDDQSVIEYLGTSLAVAIKFDQVQAAHTILSSTIPSGRAMTVKPKAISGAFIRCNEEMMMLLLCFSNTNLNFLGENELQIAFEIDPEFVSRMMKDQRFSHLLPFWDNYLPLGSSDSSPCCDNPFFSCCDESPKPFLYSPSVKPEQPRCPSPLVFFDSFLSSTAKSLNIYSAIAWTTPLKQEQKANLLRMSRHVFSKHDIVDPRPKALAPSCLAGDFSRWGVWAPSAAEIVLLGGTEG